MIPPKSHLVNQEFSGATCKSTGGLVTAEPLKSLTWQGRPPSEFASLGLPAQLPGSSTGKSLPQKLSLLIELGMGPQGSYSFMSLRSLPFLSRR